MATRQKPSERKEAERFHRIYSKLKPYVAGACIGFGYHFRHIESKDLEQECAIKLLALLRTGKFTDADLIEVFKRAVYNLLRDYYRAYKRAVQLTSLGPASQDREEGEGGPGPGLESVPDPSADVFDRMLLHEYSTQIRRALGTELQKQVFDLLIHPDRETVDLAESDLVKAVQKRKSGKLVTRPMEVLVQAKHISTRLQVSPATVSRALAEIRRVARGVLD